MYLFLKGAQCAVYAYTQFPFCKGGLLAKKQSCSVVVGFEVCWFFFFVKHIKMPRYFLAKPDVLKISFEISVAVTAC